MVILSFPPSRHDPDHEVLSMHAAPCWKIVWIFSGRRDQILSVFIGHFSKQFYYCEF